MELPTTHLWFYSVLDQSIIENQATYTQLPEQAPTEVWTPPHFRSDNATCYCISRSPVASLLLVGNKGLEPLHLSILEPKSSASANSANSPDVAPAYIWLPEKRCAETSGWEYSHNNKRLTAGCPGGARTHDILINSQALVPTELQGNIKYVFYLTYIL